MRNFKITMTIGGKVVFGIMAIVGLVLGTMFIIYGHMWLVGIICYFYTLGVLGKIFSQVTVTNDKLYYRNTFFITKEYEIKEIKRVKLKTRLTSDDTIYEKSLVAVVYNQKKKRMFTVSNRMVNYDKFMNFISIKGISVKK